MTDQLTEEHSGAELAPAARPPALRVAWAPIPKVNLLPIEILENRRFRRILALLGVAVAVVLLLVGGGTYLAQRGVTKANDQLTASQARVSELQAEEAKYAAVPQLRAQVDAAVAARRLAMATDVLWYRYLNDIDGARPTGVEVSDLTVTLAAAASGGAATSPLASAGIGSMVLNGTADEYAEVASWLEAVNKITGISSSTLTSAAKADGTVTWSLTAVIDTNALSARYTKDAG